MANMNISIRKKAYGFLKDVKWEERKRNMVSMRKSFRKRLK